MRCIDFISHLVKSQTSCTFGFFVGPLLDKTQQKKGGISLLISYIQGINHLEYLLDDHRSLTVLYFTI